MDIKKLQLFLFLLIPAIASAHGGRTDKYGCHNDRKHGGYHCHNGGASTPSYSPSINSVDSNTNKTKALAVQPASSPVRERNLAAYKDLVTQIQTALNKLGYSVGTPDGILGAQTVNAIRRFQTDNKIAVDGRPTYMLLEILLAKIGKGSA